MCGKVKQVKAHIKQSKELLNHRDEISIFTLQTEQKDLKMKPFLQITERRGQEVYFPRLA